MMYTKHVRYHNIHVTTTQHTANDAQHSTHREIEKESNSQFLHQMVT